MKETRTKVKWWQMHIDAEYHPHFFSWKECESCKCFFNNDEDIIFINGIWLCNKCKGGSK